MTDAEKKAAAAKAAVKVVEDTKIPGQTEFGISSDDTKKEFMDAMRSEMNDMLAAARKEIIDAANKEAADIIAAAHIQTYEGKEYPAESDKTAEEAAALEAWANEIVMIELILDDGKYVDDVTVSHNGKTWVIQRGEEVPVPRYIAAILENTKNQDRAAARYRRAKEKEYQDGLKKFVQ